MLELRLQRDGHGVSRRYEFRVFKFQDLGDDLPEGRATVIADADKVYVFVESPDASRISTSGEKKPDRCWQPNVINFSRNRKRDKYSS